MGDSGEACDIADARRSPARLSLAVAAVGDLLHALSIAYSRSGLIQGPACGISGAAEACLRSGHASGARLEEALAILGTESLTSLYQRTGQGWQARHDTRGGISWEPLTAHPRDTDPLPGLGYAR